MKTLGSLKVGVTGASGFVGRHVVRLLKEHGHEVVAFSRSPDRPVPGCVETRAFGAGREIKVSGLDAVIHLAGESVLGYWTPEKKRRILESRRDGTRALVDAILATGERRPKVLISASAVGFYGDTGDLEVDENAPAGKGFLADVAKVWEQEALRAETGGLRVVLLRIGMVLGDDGGAMKLLKPVFQLGLGAKLGNGRHWVPWVDVVDVAGLAVFSLENSAVRGPVNATAPRPLRNEDFTNSLAKKYHRKAFFVAPTFVLKAALGEMSDVVLSSHRVIPKRTEQFGFSFVHRDL